MSVMDVVRKVLEDYSLPEGTRVFVNGVEFENVEGGMVDAHVEVDVVLPSRVEEIVSTVVVR